MPTRTMHFQLFRSICRFACVTVFVLLSFCANGQEYIFNRLTQADGLASNFIHCLWQDKKGFIWIGSENGLQRYDGRTFFSPNINTGTSLPFAAVNQIMADGKGRMWVRCGDIVGIFDPGTFAFRAAKVNITGDADIREGLILHRDWTGQMYLVQRRNKIFYFDEASFSFDRKFTPYEIKDNWQVFTTCDDTLLKRTWISYNNRLICYDWTSKQIWNRENNPLGLLPIQDSMGPINHLAIDKNRRLWINFSRNNQNFRCYKESANRYTSDTAGLTSSEEKGYFELRHFGMFSDSLLFAYGTNVFQVFEKGRFVNMEDRTPPGTFEYENVEQVFEDREGIIWVASDNGLYNLTRESRKTSRFLLPKKSGILFNAACQLPDGDLLLNAFGQGIYRYDENLSVRRPGIIKPRHPDPYYNNSWTIFSNLADSTVWIGGQAGRLTIYDFNTGKLRYYHPAPFGRGTIVKMMDASNGYLWICLSNGDLFRWKQGSRMEDSSFTLATKIPTAVTEMFEHTDGNVYISTRGSGVYAVAVASGDIVKQYSTLSTPKLSSNYVGDVGPVNDSVVCFTADVANIINLNTGAVTYMSRYNDELMGDPFLHVQDRFGDLWFICTNGFFRYTDDPGYLRKFSQWDGLSIPNSSIAVMDRRLLRNGSILLVGNLNAIVFDPANYRSRNKPGDVLISNFLLDGKYLPLDSVLSLKTVHLSQDQNSLAISFSIPGFGLLNKHLYQYKLEGVDADWVKAGEVREARYSLLPAGKYTFRVRALNEEGIFSDRETTLRIVIHPPFWKTWWFISLIILVIAIASYQLHRMRIRQLLKVERVRARLASDLHDDMGSTLSTINILSTIAKGKLGENNEDVGNHLESIGQNSSRVMEAMDDIVWSINPRNDDMKKIVARMREFGSNTLEAKNIEFSLSVSEEIKDLKFDMESRKDIFLLFKEAVNNIVKYAEAKTVRISLGVAKGYFTMQIKDDGKGFDPAIPVTETRGNGLRNMKARAEALRGTLSIESQPGNGTSITLKAKAR